MSRRTTHGGTTVTTRRMGRIAAAGALAGALAGAFLLLAGCSGGAETTPAPAPEAVPQVTGTPTTQSAPSSQPGVAQPTRAEVPSDDGAATGPQRCTTGELSASLGQGDAGAGSAFFPLVFTNTGSR